MSLTFGTKDYVQTKKYHKREKKPLTLEFPTLGIFNHKNQDIDINDFGTNFVKALLKPNEINRAQLKYYRDYVIRSYNHIKLEKGTIDTLPSSRSYTTVTLRTDNGVIWLKDIIIKANNIKITTPFEQNRLTEDSSPDTTITFINTTLCAGKIMIRGKCVKEEKVRNFLESQGLEITETLDGGVRLHGKNVAISAKLFDEAVYDSESEITKVIEPTERKESKENKKDQVINQEVLAQRVSSSQNNIPTVPQFPAPGSYFNQYDQGSYVLANNPPPVTYFYLTPIYVQPMPIPLPRNAAYLPLEERMRGLRLGPGVRKH